jgi:Uma2 family endonuclease
MQINIRQIEIKPGQQLFLKDVDWKSFENLLEEFGEKRTNRISYSAGELEIMSPLAVHEDDKEIVGNLVEIILEFLNVEFRSLGSTTFKKKSMKSAVEPDSCFYIENEIKVRGKARINLNQDPPPDLAIEIDITSRTHFDNYEKLGVPELWRYNGETLEISILKEKQYENAENSLHFPQFNLKWAVPYFVEHSKIIGRNATMKEFRQWLNEEITK